MASILVLGAGELGTQVLRSLAAHPSHKTTQSISVLLRPSTINSPSPSKSIELAALHALGIILVPGDIVQSSPTELSSILRPYGTVISCTGFSAGHGTQVKIARASIDAGVRRFVPWQFGVDYDVIGRGSAQDLFDEQLDVRDLLRAQTLTEWVIVSTGMFTSFLFDPYFGVVTGVQKNGNEEAIVVRALGGWDNRVTVTTAEDIGKLTADILFAEPRLANRAIYTAGETVSFARLADVLEKALGRNVTREEWSVEWLEGELAKHPNDTLWKYRVVFGKGLGTSWDEAQSFNVQRDIETVDVEGWIKENLGQ